MKRSGRFSVALHLLVFLDKQSSGPATSELLAACVGTHAVVVRRTLAGLRRAGLVRSAGGHGGGWSLARHASDISLRDVYAALGERFLVAVDVPDPEAGCQISSAVSLALNEVLREADALLEVGLGRIRLADVAARVQIGRHHHRGHGGASNAG
ncbi:MAG: Rrf2 family transcriptional regulator [Polyangiaceae bacterium]